MIMEWVEYPTLKKQMKRSRVSGRGGCLTEEFAKKMSKQLLSALAELKEKRVVHRDIHPGNIMVDKEAKHVKLIDFGVAG